MVIADSAPIHIFKYKLIQTSMEDRKARFWNRFRRKPVYAIKKLIRGRIRKQLKGPNEKWKYLREKYSWDTRERNLFAMQEHLTKISYKYNWAPFKGKITLIQTSQNVMQVNNHDDDIWKRLAIDGVNILVAEGAHRSRFEDPDVIALAKCLQEHLDKHAEAQKVNQVESSLENKSRHHSSFNN